jgi:hypothetical protein
VDPDSMNPDPDTDPDPAFQVNPDPVWPKIQKKIQVKIFFPFFDQKNCNLHYF